MMKFPDPDSPLHFENMTQVRFYIAGTLGLLVFVLGIIGVAVLLPNAPFWVMVGVPFLLGIASLLYALKKLLAKHHVALDTQENERRKTLSAERDKQLDAMLRDNSNIPEVERK